MKMLDYKVFNFESNTYDAKRVSLFPTRSYHKKQMELSYNLQDYRICSLLHSLGYEPKLISSPCTSNIIEVVLASFVCLLVNLNHVDTRIPLPSTTIDMLADIKGIGACTCAI